MIPKLSTSSVTSPMAQIFNAIHTNAQMIITLIWEDIDNGQFLAGNGDLLQSSHRRDPRELPQASGNQLASAVVQNRVTLTTVARGRREP